MTNSKLIFTRGDYFFGIKRLFLGLWCFSGACHTTRSGMFSDRETEREALFTAVRRGDTKEASRMLTETYPLKWSRDEAGNNALDVAFQRFNRTTPDMVHTLLEHRVQAPFGAIHRVLSLERQLSYYIGGIIDQDQAGLFRNPFHFTSDASPVLKKMIDEFLALGVKIDSLDERGRTPLMVALGGNSRSMVAFLLERGASPELSDRAGSSVLMILIRVLYNLENQNIGLYSEREKPIFDLLLAHTKDKQAALCFQDGKGRNPLIYAVVCRMPLSVIECLASKKTINQRDNQGVTSFMYSAAWLNFPVMDFFMNKGADLTICDRNGLDFQMLARAKHAHRDNSIVSKKLKVFNCYRAFCEELEEIHHCIEALAEEEPPIFMAEQPNFWKDLLHIIKMSYPEDFSFQRCYEEGEYMDS